MTADPIAELLEAPTRLGEERLGVGEVAALERRPGHVVPRPCLAPLVTEAFEQRHRLAEVGPRRGDRAAEHLGEARGPQGVGEALVVAGPAEDVDGGVELAARRGEVALHVGDGAEPPPSLALGDLVVVGEGALEGVPGVGAGGRELAHVDLGRRPDQQQLPLGLRIRLAEAEGPPGMADGVLGAAGVERRLGGLVQGVHGLAGERAGHAGNTAELADQLGRRGGVMGEVLDLVEVLALLAGQGHRHAGVALGARALGERLVGDLAHDVAAEPPPAAVELEDPVGRQLEHVAAGELLVHRLGELLQGHSSIRSARARRRCRPRPAAPAGAGRGGRR